MQICQPKKNWNDTIINPCVNFLEKKGCDIKLKNTKKFDVLDNYVSTMYFDDIKIKIKREDLVIMAVYK